MNQYEKLAVCPATGKPRASRASHFQSRKSRTANERLTRVCEVGRFLGFRWNQRSAATCLLQKKGARDGVAGCHMQESGSERASAERVGKGQSRARAQTRV